MRTAIILYLPYLLSAITIWFTLAAGNKHPLAWALALVGQAGWLTWIVLSESWGFMPMNAVLWFVYFRNHLKWQEKAA